MNTADLTARDNTGLRYRHYVLGLLLVVYCFNFIDRQILAVLSPMIKADLGLSDTQLGTLKGLAFAMFYSIMGIPLAILGDRINRVKLISASLALWSAMTALSGMASNFSHLLLARVGVGVGEAGGTPPSHSLLSDYFTEEQRATALGIFSLGVPLGTLFGFIFGGTLAELYGWRMTFILVGAPGLLLALLVKLTIREPIRGALDKKGTAAAPSQKNTWHQNIRALWKMPSYRAIVYSSSLNAFCGYGLSMWLVDFFARNAVAGFTSPVVALAIAIGIGGGIGSFGGGFLADHLGKQKLSQYFSIPGLAMLTTGPLMGIALWLRPSTSVFVILFAAFFLLYSVLGPVYGLIQRLAPSDNRSLAIAFCIMWQAFVGAGLGPFTIGLLSDAFQSHFDQIVALKYAMSTVVLAAMAGGLILLFRRNQLAKDLT